MLSTKLVLLLLLLLSIFQYSSAAPYAPSECCYEHTKFALRLEALKSFYETSHDCLLQAIVFVTKNGTKVCSKPNAPWVKKAVKYLQKKNNPQAV
ncbi:chemokine (C-C motif) ligand 17 precursor [Gallus gallus]|uniref:C-C motif chemokine n=1 Tax=Gallus gallus TaxID=9031 RepID=A0A8V0ZM98_CHICK|nr:chemokine (C-C motif) ligand 17 precursor [Gallus gallus]|eukprot:NP_001280238.1 chemokine (C-C motif) ligand 17 precursor [Gallus gallus]